MSGYEARRAYAQQEGPEECRHGTCADACWRYGECRIEHLEEELREANQMADEAALEERALIVSWLRSLAGEPRRGAAERSTLAAVAGWIEDGDHESHVPAEGGAS